MYIYIYIYWTQCLSDGILHLARLLVLDFDDVTSLQPFQCNPFVATMQTHHRPPGHRLHHVFELPRVGFLYLAYHTSLMHRQMTQYMFAYKNNIA